VTPAGHSSPRTARSSATQAYAIPINEATTIAKALEAGKGSATLHVGATAFLGVQMRPVSSGSGGLGGLGFGGGSGGSGISGEEVVDVFSGSPAASAGLVAGDTITSFAGVNVQQPTSENEVSTIILNKKPGDTVKVAFVDDNGNKHSANITLGSGPPQ
jgi:S1-C subfamily serine protease